MREKIIKCKTPVVVFVMVLAAAVFLAILDVVSAILRSLGMSADGYLITMISEALAAAYVILLLQICGLKNILKERGCGFTKGFFVGGFMTVYCIFQLVAQMYLQAMSDTAVLQPAADILVYAIAMLLVGFNEELVFRGVILNLLLEKFRNTKKGVLGAVLISSVIFGCVHLTNMFSGVSAGSAVVQTIEAAILGALFAAIYLRTGNIWITIIAHAMTDFASMFASGVYGDGSFIDSINHLSAVNFIAVPIFLIPVLILLRKTKLQEIVEKRAGIVVIPGETEVEHTKITALILGIIGIVMGCAGYGLGFGVAGLMGARTAACESEKKDGLLTAALVTSIIGIVISAIAVIVMLFIMPMLHTEVL